MTEKGKANQLCSPCCEEAPFTFEPKPDIAEWIEHKATDPSWAQWRAEQAVL